MNSKRENVSRFDRDADGLKDVTVLLCVWPRVNGAVSSVEALPHECGRSQEGNLLKKSIY